MPGHGQRDLAWQRFFLFGMRARATLHWDRMHRIICDRDDALGTAGLLVAKLEQMHVISVRRKPWGKEGNHRLLQEATQQMFKELDEHSTLFQWFYNQISEELLPGTEAHIGEAEHMREAYCAAKKWLREATVGEEAKKGRWWAVEEQSRACRKGRGCTQMLLIYYGFKRGWWRTLDETPLGSGEPRSVEEVADADAEKEEAPEDPGDAAAHDSDDDKAAADDADDADAETKKLSMKSGRDEVRRRRKQCTSELLYCSRCLAREKSMRMYDGTIFFTESLGAEAQV